MVIDLQFFGGRGGASGLAAGKPVSKLMSKVYFNSAKESTALRGSGAVKRDRELEDVIRTENVDYIKSIKTKKEAARVSSYITDRISENERRLTKLGSAEAVYKNQKIAVEHRRLVSVNNAMRDKMHEFSKKVEAGNTNIHDTSRTTTTYDRARNRRMKNFDAWFNGGRK